MAISEIRAPLPGVFYRKPSPEEPSYKEVGDTVAKGDVIGLIEVMKTFTQVKSEVDGTIVEFQADTDDPVMAGQVLATVEG
ncbi:acetyl-CoA carboxylase [uncultured Hoeflea sp.]|uniref:acetyl-CoA carboxylase n=1 Tax=uncultured Hoeflea sp. TaxID=538666 RepID=UPI0026378C17|nr:acetyl-CoA carboxylase [uncultured Hoeflea sp.]